LTFVDKSIPFCIQALDKKDPNAWWNTFEVNIRGVFNFVR